MFFYKNIIIYLIAFFLTYYFYVFIIPILKKYALDKPNNRSSHIKPIPSGGGIIFSSIVSFFSFFIGNFYIFLSYPLALIGFIDDTKSISRLKRFFIQLIVVIFLILLSFINKDFIYSISHPYIFILLIPMIFVFTGLINFINFMDGIDGLIAGCMLIIFSFYSLIFNASFAILIPTLSAFLLFNWHPAKLFMGDSGSTFLGSLYVSILLSSSSVKEFMIIFSLASPIILDSSTCLLRRVFAKQNIFKPHKQHLYQRLNQYGLSHSKISFIYISATFFLCLVATLNNLIISFFSMILIILVGIYLEKNYAINFAKLI